MRSLFKGLALLIAVACAVWLTVLWHWQSTQRVMSSQDIVLYLGLMPLVVFGLVLLGRWAWQSAARSQAQREEARAKTASATPTHATTAAEADPRRAPLLVWAAELECAAGNSPATLQAALQAGDPRPSPQAQWRDDEGLPVLCAPIPELDESVLDEHGEAPWHPLPGPDGKLSPLDPAIRRALAALVPPLQRACQTLQARAELGIGPAHSAGTRDRASAAPTQALTVRLMPVWPAHWPPAVQSAAHIWLQTHAQQWLAPSVPAEQVLLQRDAALEGQPRLWPQVEQLLNALAREDRQDVLMLVASHSDLSDARLQQLQRDGGLFSAHTPKGRMPAEAAAVLAVSRGDWLSPEASASADPALAALHRPSQQLRDKPVDAPGRVSAQISEAVLDAALQLAGVAAAEVRAIVSDADQHTGRATELFGAMLSRLPHLDAAEDALVAGPLLGRASAVAPLISLALAAHRATDNEGPVLALSVDDPLHRLAFVLRPISDLAVVANPSSPASPAAAPT